MKIVVGMGEALFDCLPEGKKIGGAPANFAYHASQFGLDSRVVSAVGEDADGDEILRIFGEKNLKGIIERVPYPTGTVQVTLDDKGIPQYDICQGVAWDNIPFSAELEALARQTDAVCFGSLAQRSEGSRQTILRFLEAVPEDSLKIFDINLRQQFYTEEVITESLKRCNVLKINDEELVIVARMFGIPGADAEEQCRWLLEKYALRMLILTCGTEGSYVFAPDFRSFQPTPKVEVADTVGAGDSFTGSFTAAILQEKSITEAHALAVKVSAFVCTQSGAMPVLPYIPQPVDLSDVVLPDGLLELREKIAKNAHEVWAENRINDGWTYGPVRNDALKQHPDLIPYEDLTDGEREYDRATAMNSIKLLIKLGYKIEKG